MIDKANLDKTNAWPFVEAKKILNERETSIKKKGKIILQTGYGPSGLPHIGTFGEVARTSMIVNALDQITDLPKEIITFSDDMDGFRKVPRNIPNQEMLANYIDMPLTKVPDPFGTAPSYGMHNNHRLKAFLDGFGFAYEFKSSTECYTNGDFDATLIRVLEHYDAIMAIMLPTLGPERQATYSPFFPICPETGHVLEVEIISISTEKNTVVYLQNNKEIEQSILDGNCKLQWKVDWAMRWCALDIDYEMYGKDLIESAILSTKIINLLGKKSPSGFAYELFLDEKGEKISKSKGNGITIDQWLKYASPESLSLYMYQNPKRAKKLYKEIVPKAVDEYLDNIEKSKKQTDHQLIMNPVWHVHEGKIPTEEMIMTFSMLLNLVETSNADSKDLLWKFVKKYKPNIQEENFPIFDGLVGYAIKYFNDVIKSQKKYKKPSESEKKAGVRRSGLILHNNQPQI